MIEFVNSISKPWIVSRFLFIPLYVANCSDKYSNIRYHVTVVRILLILGCIETNPGPSNNMRLSSLKIAHNNVCSLLPKLDIITAELSHFDIVTISETHLDNSIENEVLGINGFHPPIRLDRNRHGGGVAMYISNELAFYERKDLNTINLEIVWSEVHLIKKKFLLVYCIGHPIH